MQGIQDILAELRTGDWWTRKNALDRLAAYPPGDYLNTLEHWLRSDADADARNAAMEAFTALGDRALVSLFSLITDDDTDIRLFSANILGDIGSRDAVPVLIAALNDLDANVKIAAAEALGKIGDERALYALKKLLHDDLWVAMSALQAIGDVGGQEALKILYECLGSEETRDFAITAIEKAGDRQSIPLLAEFIASTDHSFHRDIALNAIIHIAEREKVRLKADHLKNLVPVLMQRLDEKDPESRKAAFIALCWSEDERGVPYFIDAVDDEVLQEYAIDGLLTAGRQAAPAIIDAMNRREGRSRQILVKVLSMLGEHNALMQFRKDEDPGVRVEVGLALGSVNSPTSIRALLRMLSDPYDEVRLAARRSLDSLHGKK